MPVRQKYILIMKNYYKTKNDSVWIVQIYFVKKCFEDYFGAAELLNLQ